MSHPGDVVTPPAYVLFYQKRKGQGAAEGEELATPHAANQEEKQETECDEPHEQPLAAPEHGGPGLLMDVD